MQRHSGWPYVRMAGIIKTDCYVPIRTMCLASWCVLCPVRPGASCVLRPVRPGACASCASWCVLRPPSCASSVLCVLCVLCVLVRPASCASWPVHGSASWRPGPLILPAARYKVTRLLPARDGHAASLKYTGYQLNQSEHRPPSRRNLPACRI